MTVPMMPSAGPGTGEAGPLAATRGQCGSSVGSFGRTGWLPSLVQRTELWQGQGQGLCVIPEFVRKPDPVLLVLSPAVGPQAPDLPPPTP